MLATLYKKTSTGAIQEWSIFTQGDTYWTVSGQVDGKKITSTPTECEGKNLGKANETLPTQQAEKEAFSKWESKKKKGYVEDPKAAQSGDVNKDYVAGGYKPMLAEKFRDKGHKISYPCFGQPKLDGHRGVVECGKLFSRTQKRILSCPHLENAINTLELGISGLDGELYNHDLKDEFEQLSSAIRQSKPMPECEVVQYHIYDLALNIPMHERVRLLKDMEGFVEGTPAAQYLKFVPTEYIESPEQAKDRHDFWVGQGFEGYMLRNGDAVYQNKRTADLQKVKVFQDAEFKVVGVEDGKGKFKDIAAKFICEVDDERGPRTFKATANGSLEQLKEYYDNFDKYKGQMLTVEFMTYTRKNYVPKHGRGLRFRDTRF